MIPAKAAISKLSGPSKPIRIATPKRVAPPVAAVKPKLAPFTIVVTDLKLLTKVLRIGDCARTSAPASLIALR